MLGYFASSWDLHSMVRYPTYKQYVSPSVVQLGNYFSARIQKFYQPYLLLTSCAVVSYCTCSEERALLLIATIDSLEGSSTLGFEKHSVWISSLATSAAYLVVLPLIFAFHPCFVLWKSETYNVITFLCMTYKLLIPCISAGVYELPTWQANTFNISNMFKPLTMISSHLRMIQINFMHWTLLPYPLGSSYTPASDSTTLLISTISFFNIAGSIASKLYRNFYSRPIIHSFECNGTEESVFDCQFSSTCRSHQDGSVICHGL